MQAVGSLAEPWALDPGDTRSPQQRRADALVEICRRHLDSSDRPRPTGERPHLVLTLTPADLAADDLVDLESGPISAEAARPSPAMPTSPASSATRRARRWPWGAGPG